MNRVYLAIPALALGLLFSGGSASASPLATLSQPMAGIDRAKESITLAHYRPRYAKRYSYRYPYRHRYHRYYRSSPTFFFGLSPYPYYGYPYYRYPYYGYPYYGPTFGFGIYVR